MGPNGGGAISTRLWRGKTPGLARSRKPVFQPIGLKHVKILHSSENTCLDSMVLPSRVLLEKLTVVKKFPAFCVTRSFLTAFTRAHRLVPILSPMNPVHTKIKRHTVKVKLSRKRPGVTQRVPGGVGSQIFMTFGT